MSELPLTAQRLIFKTYTEEDGLVSNPVRRIFQDSKGFIWIGTWQGLSKYDGHKFTNYTTVNGLSDNLINDMYESPDGRLYVAENNGNVDIVQKDAVAQKAAVSNVLVNRFFITRNRRVIVATDTSGLYEIEKGKFTKPPQALPYFTYNAITDLNDSLFIAGSEGPLLVLNHQFEIVTTVKQPKDLLVFKIYKDSKNRVWVGTNKGLKLVSLLSGTTLPAVQHNPVANVPGRPDHFTLLPALPTIPGLSNSLINDMLEDVTGNLWVATSNGLFKIDSKGGWQLFSDKDGLPSSDIICLYQDRENNIWIGTTLGLTKLVTKTIILHYTDQDGLLLNSVSYFAARDKSVFLLGTNPGLQVYNTTNNHFTYARTAPLLYGGVVANSRPLLFFGNDNRFDKFDTTASRIVNYISPGSVKAIVYCAVMDTNGIIFSGTQEGLIIRSGGKSWYETKLSHRITFLLLDKKGFLWAGTWNNGLFRIQYTGKEHNISITVKDFSELLPDRNIRCLFEDRKGNIWVGTRQLGIVQLQSKGAGQFTAHRFDLRQGLMSNWARVITEDHTGNIWVGSNLGLDKLLPVGNSFRVFNFSRVNNYFDQINAIIPADNNSLWLATNKGLINIIDGKMEKIAASSIYITSIKLGDTTFNYTNYNLGAKVKLKYYQNQAAFGFSAPGFINEKQLLYSYRLTGSSDTTWSKPSNLQTVSYASLQPGTYRFEVRTAGWNGEWGDSADFVFTIGKPYWQTWWFYSLIGIFLSLFLYGIYRYRIKQLLHLQKVRNRIASDLHDDIGSTLTNINMLSEISRKNLEQPKEAEKFLQRITEEVTLTSQALNDIIWSVNSRNDSIEEIFTRMRRYAADLFDNSNTSCHLNLDKTIAEKKLNMEQRRDIYLIYKESMNNILKHAFAKNVWIELLWRENKLHLKVNDDGKGFEPSVVTTSNGLKNIRSRAVKWKGYTTIKSSPGNGTQIEIILPLAE